jgi:hypothetical protein
VPMKTAICAVSAFVLREFSVQWHSRGECLQFQIPLAIQLGRRTCRHGKERSQGYKQHEQFCHSRTPFDEY